MSFFEERFAKLEGVVPDSLEKGGMCTFQFQADAELYQKVKALVESEVEKGRGLTMQSALHALVESGISAYESEQKKGLVIPSWSQR